MFAAWAVIGLEKDIAHWRTYRKWKIFCETHGTHETRETCGIVRLVRFFKGDS